MTIDSSFDICSCKEKPENAEQFIWSRFPSPKMGDTPQEYRDGPEDGSPGNDVLASKWNFLVVSFLLSFLSPVLGTFLAVCTPDSLRSLRY